MKKIPFIQSTKNGCGSISLANIFNDERYLPDYKDPKEERFVDLNRKLMRHDPHIYVEPVYLTCGELEVGNRLLAPAVLDLNWAEMEPEMKETQCMPLLLTIRHKSGLYHAIGIVINFKNKMFYVLDSLQIYVQRLTVNELISNYHIVSVSRFGLWTNDDPANNVVIHKDGMTHIFEDGE